MGRQADAPTGASRLHRASKFTHPVPRRTARNHHRLRGRSFSELPQRPDGGGPVGFGLSAVLWDDAVELLSVCGIPPEALAGAGHGPACRRLRASVTGNPLFLRLRYDAVLRDRVRRIHEREAERRAESWAAANGYVNRAEYQHVPLAGFDLLFADAAGTHLQVEVKGYASPNLARVHLQPSQAWRAQDAAQGMPPDWRLFALLGAGSKRPTEKIVEPARVMSLVAARGLQVKGGCAHPTTDTSGPVDADGCAGQAHPSNRHRRRAGLGAAPLTAAARLPSHTGTNHVLERGVETPHD